MERIKHFDEMNKKIVLFLCLVVMADIVTGQSIKRYEGKMMLPSDLDQLKGVVARHYVGGDGYYDYYENDDDNRVKHGEFYLKVDGYGDQGFIIRGTYSHGKKVGQWTFIPPVSQGYIKSYYNSMKITYKDDVLYGPCEYSTRPTQGLPATVTISCNFTNGILTGDASVKYLFDYNSVTNEYRGKIDKEGLLYGIWSVSKKGGIETSQKWMYYKGAGVYAESLDYSTGERTVVYSAFDNLKKTPDLDKIKDTVVMGQECIVYEGQVAIKVSSDYFFPPIITNFPDGMCFSDLLVQQEDSWRYTYSSKAFGEMFEVRKREREKQIEDSIQIEQHRREYEAQLADYDFKNYLIQLYHNYVKRIETYNGRSTFVSLTPQNTDGKVRKCNNEDGIISFKIGEEIIKGRFSKNNVKTSAGEIFVPDPPFELWSNEDGSALIFQCSDHGSQCALLIIRNGPNKGVYSFSLFAQKCW